MDIDIRCEECGEYLEIEKEWADRNGINITVNPLAQALADKRLELLKRVDKEMEIMYRLKIIYPASLDDLWTDIVSELAEAIAEE